MQLLRWTCPHFLEFVNMIEADTIVHSRNTLHKPELMAKLWEKYKQLITTAISSSHFCQVWIEGIHDC
jgi:hypothetical protein